MFQFYACIMDEPAEYKAISYVLFLFKIVCSFIKDKLALSCFVLFLENITPCVFNGTGNTATSKNE